MIRTAILNLLVFSSTGLVPLLAGTQPHDPTALWTALNRVRETSGQGIRAIVILDLDDTLFDAGSRTLRILREFARVPAVALAHPDLSARLEALTPRHMYYDLGRNLTMLGVSNQEVAAQAREFWTVRFFSNAYCQLDEVVPGAPQYVHALRASGAHIVYLSGRDEPRMGAGTRASLALRGFPFDEHSDLILKQDATQDDTVFKKAVFARLASTGRVVAGFDNEPANVNALAAAFPAAFTVFLDTRHSSKPDEPNASIPWIGDFRTSRNIARLLAHR